MADDNSDFGLAVGEIRAGVRYLTASMDQLRDNMKEMRAEFRKETTELSHRITHVEAFMWKATGAAAFTSIVFPVAVTLVMKWFMGG